MYRRLALPALVAATAMLVLAPSAAAGGGCHPGADLEMSASSKSSMTIDECAFGTTVTYVEPGERVTWTNRDVVPHTVTGAASSWGDEGFLDNGEKVSYAFDEEGVYPYYCALHPTMVGAVVVGDATSTAMLEGAVEKVEDAVPLSADDTSGTGDSGGGLTTTTLALSVAAVLAVAFLATRYVLGRRVAGSA